MENWHSCVWYKNSHIRYLDFIQDFQDAACAAVTLQVYLFCGNYWEFKITSWSISHKKVHSACLEHLAPTDGTPGIGNGCQIKLAFKAAGEVNWRLGIQVDIGCWIELWNLKVGKSLKIGKNWIKSEKSDLISYPTFWQKCQNAINCHKMPKCLHFGSGSCIRIS